MNDTNTVPTKCPLSVSSIRPAIISSIAPLYASSSETDRACVGEDGSILLTDEGAMLRTIHRCGMCDPAQDVVCTLDFDGGPIAVERQVIAIH